MHFNVPRYCTILVVDRSKVECLRPIACWECGFESRQGHGFPSLVTVVCYQVEVSVTGRLLVHRSPTDCDVTVCDLETSTIRRPWSELSSYVKEREREREKQCTILYCSVLMNHLQACSHLVSRTRFGPCTWPVRS